MNAASFSEVAREASGLVFARIPTHETTIARAVRWRNALVRVGVHAPLFVIHDLGSLFSTEAPLEEPSTRPAKFDHRAYVRLIDEIAESEVCRDAREMALRDELIEVLLLRVLGQSAFSSPRDSKLRASQLPLDASRYLTTQSAESSLSDYDLQFLSALLQQRLKVVLSVEQLDLRALSLLGLLGEGALSSGALGWLDWASVLGNSEASDIASFSLDLLPSVLETKRATGVQTFSVDGYAGLVRRGNPDALVHSELAYDDDLFDRRYIENETLYYAREKHVENERCLHYIVCDATASMRGQRSVFARGLSLALIKSLALRGEDVFFRFFDAQLHDVQVTRAQRRGVAGVDVPYLLTFRGEHGRNYPKVFGLLASELERVRRRERKRVTLYVVTHAECHIPVDVVSRLNEQATVNGIFMLPSAGTLDLDYVDRLTRVEVVDEGTFARKERRAERALEILQTPVSERPQQNAQGGRATDLVEAEREVEQLLGERS